MLSNIEIGRRLKDLRLQRGITIEELSADTGISISSLNKYEIGNRRPRDENKAIFANNLTKYIDKIIFL